MATQRFVLRWKFAVSFSIAAASMMMLVSTMMAIMVPLVEGYAPISSLTTLTRYRYSRLDKDTNTGTMALFSFKKTAVIAGATGYIGKATVKESIRQGYETFALVRNATQVNNDHRGRSQWEDCFKGAHVVECNVCDPIEMTKTMRRISEQSPGGKIDLLVSCLASRSGIKKDAYAIDYQATLNFLESGRAIQAGHFVLLSAFCVRNPWLQFQQAKLKFEAALQSQNDITWTIVRPTAFFKSVSGQVEVVRSGAPYLMFGDGTVTRCNPIAESDLARFMVSCAKEPLRFNKIINLGGPDEPLTMRMQCQMIFQAVGMEPSYIQCPLWLFDVIIDTLQFLANLSQSETLEDMAEVARIGKYYAVEDMLTTDPGEKYGTIKLQEYYDQIAQQGQEYDPYTRVVAEQRAGILRLLKPFAATMS